MKKFILSDSYSGRVTSFLKKASFGPLTALVSATSFADWVATGPGYAITAREMSCHASVLKHVKDEYHSIFHKADALIEGKSYVGCWAVVDGTVYLIFEDGEQATLPESDFRKLQNV